MFFGGHYLLQYLAAQEKIIPSLEHSLYIWNNVDKHFQSQFKCHGKIPINSQSTSSVVNQFKTQIIARYDQLSRYVLLSNVLRHINDFLGMGPFLKINVLVRETCSNALQISIRRGDSDHVLFVQYVPSNVFFPTELFPQILGTEKFFRWAT